MSSISRPDLATWLLQQIAEDEAVAQAATPGPWEWDRTSDGEWGHQPPDLVTVAQEECSYTLNDGTVRTYTTHVGTVVSSWGHDADGVEVSDEDAEHIARWDPARVLAECEAKRRIVELHAVTVTEDWVNPTDGPAYREDDHMCGICGWVRDACDTVKLLALPYADRPGYRQEWAP